MYVPAAVLAALFAVAALGWIGYPPGRVRRGWMVVGIGLVVLAVATLPLRVDDLRDARSTLKSRAQVSADLDEVLSSPAAQATLERCGAPAIGFGWYAPRAALATETSPSDVVAQTVSHATGARQRGVLVRARPGLQVRRDLFSPQRVLGGSPNHRAASISSAGYRVVASTPSFQVLERGCSGTGDRPGGAG